MSGFTSECVYLDNTSKMRMVFIHASHNQRNYNNHMSMVTSQPSAGKPITAGQVLIIFKHYGIQTGKTFNLGIYSKLKAGRIGCGIKVMKTV